LSIACWKYLGSPTINQPPTTLKVFDGRGFHSYGILNALPIELEGKMVAIDVEVVMLILVSTYYLVKVGPTLCQQWSHCFFE